MEGIRGTRGNGWHYIMPDSILPNGVPKSISRIPLPPEANPDRSLRSVSVIYAGLMEPPKGAPYSERHYKKHLVGIPAKGGPIILIARNLSEDQLERITTPEGLTQFMQTHQVPVQSN